ncbi:ATPase [Thermincola potens]|uniref:ATPase n=1 Tax=Thermincola potens (strain JR) TaxID=635013 RepID=D5X8Q4_THEPJ|nr:ATPase [Thermincola potens]ADG82930.1 conserved hypothetical protein [Thermincola potens JR]
MDILDVLNELEEVIEESTKLPLVGKVLVDDELILDMIDHIRTSLPEEMRQAKAIVLEREKILEEAKLEAQRIIKEAKEEIAKMAGQDEIVKQAQEQAQAIVEQTNAVAREIKIGAYQYSDDLLKHVEEVLEKSLLQVRSGRAELQAQPQKQAEKEQGARESA